MDNGTTVEPEKYAPFIRNATPKEDRIALFNLIYYHKIMLLGKPCAFRVMPSTWVKSNKPVFTLLMQHPYVFVCFWA